MTKLLAVLLFFVPTVLIASPAAADDQLSLSMDGAQWHQSLTEPLFNPSARWVPGDVKTSKFLVRNQAADAGDLTLDVLRTNQDALVQIGWLHISARAGSGSWTRINEAGDPQLVDATRVPAGAVLPIQVRVALSPEAPNGTQVLGTDLDFRVTLTDVRANPGTGPDDGSGPLLPDTGLSASWWLPMLGLVLLATGVLLVVGRRRREETTPPHTFMTHTTPLQES